MSFYSAIPTELLYSLPAPVTKNTYTTQALISAPSSEAPAIVPAGIFGGNPNGIGRALLLKAAGTMANTAAATFQMVLGWDPTPGTLGTTLATPWPTLAPTASVVCPWTLEAVILCQATGSAGLTLQLNGEMRVGVVAAGTLSTAPQSILLRTTSTGLVATAQAALELWGTWNASSASNTTTLDCFELFGCN